MTIMIIYLYINSITLGLVAVYERTVCHIFKICYHALTRIVDIKFSQCYRKFIEISMMLGIR